MSDEMMDGRELPEGWRRVKLREVCSKTKLTDPTKRADEFFTYIDVSSVSNETYKVVETKEILGKDAPSRARKAVRTDDVIFATVRPTLKRIALIPAELDGQVCSTGYCVVRAELGKAVPGFLYFFLLTEEVLQQVDILQKGATYPAISDADLFNLPLILRPLPEQRAIAQALRTVQAAREARRREAALEREHKAALMQRLFTQGTRGEPTKTTEIGEVPVSWAVVRLGEVCKISTGTTPSTERADYYIGDVPFVKTAEIANCRIRETEVSISDQAVRDYNLKLCPVGSVFIAMYGQGKTRGQVALLEIAATTTQNTAAIVPHEDVDSEFLWQSLLSQYERLRDAGSQGHISHLNLGYVKAYPFILPRPEEQRTIAEVLRACDEKIAALGREAAAHDELFKALLAELMTGRMRTTALVAE